jgi:hypothetical protein
MVGILIPKSTSLAYSSSTTLSSSFLNNGAISLSACPAGNALTAHVPAAPLWSYVNASGLRVSSWYSTTFCVPNNRPSYPRYS